MRIIAIIPARGGSKRLINKNVYPLKGKPLISYTIEACKKSSYIDEIYVSSDSVEILKIAIECGVKGVERDKKFADDKTPKIVAVREALKQDKIIVDGIPDIIIIPQANSPQITAEVMDKGFELLINHNLWEVMSTDEKGVQNAAFRIIRTEHISNTFLSAHCGFITANIIDVHSIDDILKLEELL